MTLTEYRKNRPRTICPNCGKSFTNACFQRHYDACINPNSRLNQQLSLTSYHVDHEDLNCKFCNRSFKSKNAVAQHELRCKNNPNRKDYNKVTDYVINNLKGQTKDNNEVIAKQAAVLKSMYETGELIPAAKGKPGTFLGKHHTKEEIDKMMSSYRYTLERRGHRYKFGTYKGIRCDSGWELAFILYYTDQGFEVTRCTESFDYWHPLENRNARYYPDFKINNIYYEVKGIIDDVTLAKGKHFPSDKILILVGPEQFEYILGYCLDVYGNDFYRMYDRNYPSWMDIENNFN